MFRPLSVPLFTTAFSIFALIVRADGPYQYHPLAPCRLADTRSGNGGVMTPSADRSFQVQGLCGVPNGAKAASLNLTVVAGAGSNGFVTLYPGGMTRPNVSTVNFVATDIIANGALVPLGAAGTPPNSDLRAFAGASGNVHVILDVTGYFE
jgi:hypothetical protein